MKPRKVLLAAMSLGYGGAETHVVDLARELSFRGVHVTVASAGGSLVQSLEALAIEHVSIPLDRRSPAQLLRAIGAGRRLVTSLSPDIIHAHGRIPAWVFSKANSKMPLVTTYHGVYTAGFPWNRFTVQGDESIAVATDIEEHLLQNFGFDPSYLRVIPNGIDTERFAPVASEVVRKPGPVITNVSRIDEHAKPAFSLVETLPALSKRHPGVAAVIVGDGYRLAELTRCCEHMNAVLGREAARAVGAQHDVVPYILASDIVIAVARAALEAMACQKPVVFAGEGGLSDILTDDNLEIFRRHNFTSRGSNRTLDSDALFSELDTLLKNPDVAERTALLGRKVVLDEYSWRTLMPSIMQTYEKAIRERRRSDAVVR